MPSQEERDSGQPKDTQEQRPDEQLSTSGVKDNTAPDSSSVGVYHPVAVESHELMHHVQAREEPSPSNSHPPDSETHSDDDDLLEITTCSFHLEASAHNGIGCIAIQHPQTSV